MYDIITLGSGTIDCFVNTGKKLFIDAGKGNIQIPFGSKILVDDVEFYTGGGGTNCAASLSRLGLKAAWIGKLGPTHNGDIILQEMKKEKVDTSMVVRSKNSRTGFSVILDAKGHDRTILAYKGSNDDLRFSEIKTEKVQAKWMYCSSMLGRSFETLEKMVGLAGKNGIKVAFNPSAYLAKKGAKYLSKVLAGTSIAVMNDEEAYYLTKEKDIKKSMQRILMLGPQIAVITKGSRGVEAYDGKRFYSLKAHKTKVVEATGAGDAFASAFLAGIIRKNDIGFALKLGLANAESVIQHSGAKNNLLTWQEAIQRIK